MHRGETEIEGLPAYASILDISGKVVTASLYVPPMVGLDLADLLSEKRVREATSLHRAGSEELKQKLQEAGIDAARRAHEHTRSVRVHATGTCWQNRRGDSAGGHAARWGAAGVPPRR